MWAYVQNIAYALIIMAGFAVAGGFAIIPFRKDVRYALLLAPLIGLLLTTLGALAGYVLFRLPMRAAGISSLLCCCCVTLASNRAARIKIDWKKATISAAVIAAITILQTTVLSEISIRVGGCALAYMDGTDHLGYAQVADCLRARPIALGQDFFDTVMQGPAARPPYEVWPLVLTLFDSRFGCFTFLSLISILTHRSGMFAYDLGCALALSTGVLALSGLFARNRVTLLILLASLFTCHWFDYSRGGFFAKILAYPASFVAAGLFVFSIRQNRSRLTLIVLILLVESAALMQFGLATALFLGVLGGSFLVADLIFAPDLLPLRIDRFSRATPILFGLVSISVVTSGALARPLHGFLTQIPNWVSWDYLYSRISEIESQYFNLTEFSEAQADLAAGTCLVLWVILIGVALYRRCPLALALLAGPFVLLVALRFINANWVAFQMIGVFYPLAMCGAAVLASEPGDGSIANHRGTLAMKWFVYGILVAALLIHLPRFFDAYARYCGQNAPIKQVFQKDQFDRLANELGRETVFVDIPGSTQAALAILVELGRRDKSIQWSPATWNIILGYTKRSAPSYKEVAKYRLISTETSPPSDWEQILETNQYRLLQFPRHGYSN